MIRAIKFLSAAMIVVTVSAMVLAVDNFYELSGEEQKAVKGFQALNLREYNAETLFGFLNEYLQDYSGMNHLSPVITVDQAGQLLLANELWKQLKSNWGIDCSFKSMDKIGKIEIDNIQNKVVRYLFEEKLNLVRPIYLARCVGVMREQLDYFKWSSEISIEHFLSLISEDKEVAYYLDPENFDLDYVKKTLMNPDREQNHWNNQSFWRTKINNYNHGGVKGGFLTRVCQPLEDNKIFKNIIDVVASAVENKWPKLSETEGGVSLRTGITNHHPICLYLLRVVCQHES